MKLNPEGFAVRKQIIAAITLVLREQAHLMEIGEMQMASGPEALRGFADEMERDLATRERAEILE